MITLQPVNGRIWPVSGALTFPVALTTPAGSHTSSAKNQEGIKVGPPFTCTCLDPRGDYLAGVDRLGHVYTFHLKANRYVLLDKVGSRGTCTLYHAKTLFVGFQDGSVRAYDVVKSTLLGILREHRTQILSLDVRHSTGTELLSVSQDAIIMWDCKKLTRKRCLGGGPHGALHACFTPDEQHVVAGFQDGSFYVWQASNGALVRSFMAPPLPKSGIAPAFPRAPCAPLVDKTNITGGATPALHTPKAAYTTFAISRDGQLLAAGGLRLPVILVFNLVSGSLLYGLLLPDSAQLTGIVQLMFLPLPHASTLLALCSDGSLRRIDLEHARCNAQLSHPMPKHGDSLAFSLDGVSRRFAVLMSGKVLLYDTAAVWSNNPCGMALTRLPPVNLRKMLAQVSVDHAAGVVDGPSNWPEDLHTAAIAADTAAEAQATAPPAGPTPTNNTFDSTQGATAPAPRPPAAQQGEVQENVLRSMDNIPAAWGARAVGMGKPGGAQNAVGSHDAAGKLGADVNSKENASSSLPHTAVKDTKQPTAKDAMQPKGKVVLQRSKLEGLLERFGEYPAKYRLMIWGFLLKLPRNQLAFQALVNHGLHPTVVSDLHRHYPLISKTLSTRMAHTLSQLAHWCPVFGAVSFLPGLVFPFVKLHMAGATAASSEVCFEMLASLLINWTKGWFERFPDPPVGILTRIDGLLSFQDKTLAAHLRAVQPGGVASLAWRLLQDLMSSVLTQQDWLKLWDHCITVGPDYLYYFLVAYLIALKGVLMELDTAGRLSAYLAKPPNCNCNKVLRSAYALRASTPAEIWPCATTWQPLPATGAYTAFTQYPRAAVELFQQERQKVQEAEAALARRRRVVSELSLRSTALAMQAGSMAEERRALAELQQARRHHMRQLEAVMQGEAQRLDDQAKEERLKQVAVVERAQAQALSDMRAEWNTELDSLKQDVVERRRMLASQVQRQAESEAIAHLELAAAQKLADMQHDAAQSAVLARMRDEARAHAVELESLQRRKVDEWTAQEQHTALQAQAEADKGRRVVLAAEDAAAQAAMRAEMLTSRMALQQHISQVEAERQQRTWSSQQAVLSRAAAEAEAQRVASHMDASAQSLALQAEVDASWYAAEQQRRQKQLAEQQAALQAAERQAREQLAASEAQMHLLGSQAAVLQQRRTLQVANAEEEAQMHALVHSLATERERAQDLAAQLAAQQLALQNALSAARQPHGTGADTLRGGGMGSAAPAGAASLPGTSSQARAAPTSGLQGAIPAGPTGSQSSVAPLHTKPQQLPTQPITSSLPHQLPPYSQRSQYQRTASARPPPQTSLLEEDHTGYDSLVRGVLQNVAGGGGGGGNAPASPAIPSLPGTPRTALAVLTALTRPLDEAAEAESSEEALFSRPAGQPGRRATGVETGGGTVSGTGGGTGSGTGAAAARSLSEALHSGPSLGRWQAAGATDMTTLLPRMAAGTLSLLQQAPAAVAPAKASAAVAPTNAPGLLPGSVLAALQPHAKAAAATVMHTEVAVNVPSQESDISVRETSSSSGVDAAEPRLPGLLGALQKRQPLAEEAATVTPAAISQTVPPSSSRLLQALQARVSSSSPETSSASLMASGLSSIDGIQQYGRTGSLVSHASRPTVSGSSTAAGYGDSPEVQSRISKTQAHKQTHTQKPQSSGQSQQAAPPQGYVLPVVPEEGSLFNPLGDMLVEGGQQQQQQVPAGTPSSPGGLSDIDAMLEHLRANLDLTETDEEDTLQGAFSLRSTPAAPSHPPVSYRDSMAADVAWRQPSVAPDSRPPLPVTASVQQPSATTGQQEGAQTSHTLPGVGQQGMRTQPASLQQGVSTQQQPDLNHSRSAHPGPARPTGRDSSSDGRPFFQRRQWIIPPSTSSSDNGAIVGALQGPAEHSIGSSPLGTRAAAQQSPLGGDATAGLYMQGGQQFQRTASARPPPQSTMLDDDGTGFHDLVTGVLSDAAARMDRMAASSDTPAQLSAGRSGSPVLSALMGGSTNSNAQAAAAGGLLLRALSGGRSATNASSSSSSSTGGDVKRAPS